MDPKKRTTIIVLLILTILLGIASVFIATQVQRNNAVANSYAGNLEGSLTSAEVYDGLECEDLLDSDNLSVVTTGNFKTNSYSCVFSDATESEYTFKLISIEFESAAELKTGFEEAWLTKLSSSESELSRGMSFYTIGMEDEETCSAYVGTDSLKTSYFKIELGEDICGDQDKIETLSTELENFVYKMYFYFTE